MAVPRRRVLPTPSAHLRIEEAAIYKIFMTTTIGDIPKCSTFQCCCQTKKVATLWNALSGSSAMQHKRPAMRYFVRDKGNTREHKVSGTGATLWSPILNGCKVGGPGVAIQQHQAYRTARIPKHLLPRSSDHFWIRHSEIGFCFSSLLFLSTAKRKKIKLTRLNAQYD